MRASTENLAGRFVVHSSVAHRMMLRTLGNLQRGVLYLILFNFVWAVPAALAQSPQRYQGESPAVKVTPPPSSKPTTEIELEKLRGDIRLEIEKIRGETKLEIVQARGYIKSDLDQLRADLRGLSQLMHFFVIPISIIVGLFAIGGIIIGFRSAVQAEGRATQLHELTVSGETAAQARAELVHATFLEASQKTLALVNDTLALAKQASERAAETMKLKAKRTLERIEAQVKDGLWYSLQGSDFKVVVEDRRLRASIQEAAGDVSSIEGYLQLEDIELSPVLRFVKGMDGHLKQEPNLAMRYLQEAAQTSRDKDLIAFALYWVGYELNNLGRFHDATETFRKALEGEMQKEDNPRYFELKAIELESRFFERARNLAEKKGLLPEGEIRPTIEDLSEEYEKLVKKIPSSQDFRKVRDTAFRTWGNMLTWGGRKTQVGDYKRELFRKAVEKFNAAGDGLYSFFGSLEARFDLERLGEGSVSRQDYKKVVDKVNQQLSVRKEPRTLALLNETRLIAQYHWGRSPSELEQTYRELLVSLNDVDRSLTVYSQNEKRNIPWQTFEDEVHALYSTMAQQQSA